MNVSETAAAREWDVSGPVWLGEAAAVLAQARLSPARSSWRGAAGPRLSGEVTTGNVWGGGV